MKDDCIRKNTLIVWTTYALKLGVTEIITELSEELQLMGNSDLRLEAPVFIFSVQQRLPTSA